MTKKQPVRLSRTALEQIETYVDARDDPDHGGWYYGNKEQFEKRHQAIKEWLKAEIKDAYYRHCECIDRDPLVCHQAEESTGVCYCKCH